MGAARRAEAFVFATRLTRLTKSLDGRDLELALEKARAAVPDWSGGTRIGAALSEVEHYQRIELEAMAELAHNGWRPDYIAVRRQADLQPPQNGDPDLALGFGDRLHSVSAIETDGKVVHGYYSIVNPDKLKSFV